MRGPRKKEYYPSFLSILWSDVKNGGLYVYRYMYCSHTFFCKGKLCEGINYFVNIINKFYFSYDFLLWTNFQSIASSSILFFFKLLFLRKNNMYKSNKQYRFIKIRIWKYPFFLTLNNLSFYFISNEWIIFCTYNKVFCHTAHHANKLWI